MESIPKQEKVDAQAERRRREVFSTLGDKHPVWIELDGMLREAQEHVSRLLADLDTTSEEATLLRGKLNHAYELRDALVEYRKSVPEDEPEE